MNASKQHLLEYPRFTIMTAGLTALLGAALTKNGGILAILSRYAGRAFCTPGKRLRLSKKSLYPKRLRAGKRNGKIIGLDEWWGNCTIPIVTGAIDGETGLKPLFEGEAFVMLSDGTIVRLQELIETDAKAVIGARQEAFTRETYGQVTWSIVSKKFDNLNPIPMHIHWEKDEVHDINEFDNPGVHPAHNYRTGMGLHPWVTRDMLLNRLKQFGQPGGNEVLDLSPHIFLPIGQGAWDMPRQIWHNPAHACCHEVHKPMDEHLLLQSLTLDGEISPEAAFFACRPQDYPKEKHGDWDYVLSKMDLAGNRDPDFVKNSFRPNRLAPQFCGDRVEAKWVMHGLTRGEQMCSILRLSLEPGAKCALKFESPAFFFINQGSGKVNGLELQFAKEIDLGTYYPENGFITQSAIDAGPVNFVNTGDEVMVLTLDFPANAFSTVPGN